VELDFLTRCVITGANVFLAGVELFLPGAFNMRVTMAGKASAPSGKSSFAELGLPDALTQIVAERTGRVSERTTRSTQKLSEVTKRRAPLMA